MGANTSRRFLFADFKTFCCRALMKTGVPAAQAETLAGLLRRSDVRGVESHGVTRLPICIQRLQKGYVRKDCQLTPVKDKGPTAFLEAHGSMGHIVAYRAMEKATMKELTALGESSGISLPLLERAS
jgi:LDH2 family malate/lactate/ureidoglycolate dehydrogenase